MHILTANRMAWGIAAALTGAALGGLSMARAGRPARVPPQTRVRVRGSGAAPHGKPAPLVPAYGWRGRPYQDGDYFSPDGRYLTRAQTGEAAVVTLTVVECGTGRHLAHVDDVDSFVWAPRHGHCLVVATSGLYAAALLDLWDGGRRWRSLYPVRRPDDESFTLYGATRDGGAIVYGHTLDLEKDQASLERPRRLRLPAGA